MRILSPAPYRKWMLVGLLVQLVAAWFSVGYNQPDEHFQVLEFCNYKLGLSSAAQLPWEFAAQCRPALQPFIAYCFCKTLLLLGQYNPFTVAFLLRLAMGLLTWLVTCRIVVLMLTEFATEKGRQLFVWCSFLLWFVPYIGVRFSAENIAGLLFFFAISFILELPQYTGLKRTVRLLFIGLLFGFSIFVRLQMAFAFLGLGLWLLCYSKWRIKDWLMPVFPALAAIGLCILVDHWFYGIWVFTPYNYYYVNIIKHAAASFGVSPWWYYTILFFNYAVPPVSLVLLPLFLFGLWKKPGHLFTWICIAFIAGHCLISHKEMRFLLPVSIAFIFLVSFGMDRLLQRYSGKKIFRWSIPVLAVMNILLLILKISTPAHEAVNYYQFIYNYGLARPTTLIGYNASPYSPMGLEMNFYKPKGIRIASAKTAEDITAILNNADGRTVLFLNPEIAPIPAISGFAKEKIYCFIPDWRWININDWESRSYIWSVYKLSGKK